MSNDNDPSTYLEAMVSLGLRGAAARRELDQIAEERRKALLAWIEAWGLSDYDAARRIGVTRQHLSLIRQGRTHPSDDVYAQVFDAHRALNRG